MVSALKDEMESIAAEMRAEDYVRSRLQMMTGGVVVLEKYCPWKGPVIAAPEARTIVYPSLRGGWNIEPVPCDASESAYRVHVPDAWRGKQGADAKKEMPGMTFCHAKGFVAAFSAREYAENAAEYLAGNLES